IFFFSSRRRHTISTRDWSSDVCSSDLPFASRRGELMTWIEVAAYALFPIRVISVIRGFHSKKFIFFETLRIFFLCREKQMISPRSEERRVGKECRYWLLSDC